MTNSGQRFLFLVGRVFIKGFLYGVIVGAVISALIMTMLEPDWKARYFAAQEQTNTFRSENAWLRIELDACGKGNKILKDRCMLD